jgi:hypothetical protein
MLVAYRLDGLSALGLDYAVNVGGAQSKASGRRHPVSTFQTDLITPSAPAPRPSAEA